MEGLLKNFQEFISAILIVSGYPKGKISTYAEQLTNTLATSVFIDLAQEMPHATIIEIVKSFKEEDVQKATKLIQSLSFPEKYKEKLLEKFESAFFAFAERLKKVSAETNKLFIEQVIEDFKERFHQANS